MFYTDQANTTFQNAKQAHYLNVRYIIKKKLLGREFTEPHPLGLTQKVLKIVGIASNVAKFLNDDINLKNILIGPPDILNQLKDKFKTKKAIESVKYIFRYDSFIDKNKDATFRFYNAYHLAENLKQDTCVYCNRLYTHTIVSDKKELIARPTFDHWFTKSKFPLLALSFYNLIPSCSICNSSVKGRDDYSLTDIFHPYLKHTDVLKQLNFKFSYNLENHLNAKSKIIAKNDFTGKSIEAMRLNEMYIVHNEEIRELIYLKKAYSSSYLDSLKSILKMPISDDEIYRLVFGVYLEDDLLHKRPLSKMKKDILTELGIVK